MTVEKFSNAQKEPFPIGNYVCPKGEDDIWVVVGISSELDESGHSRRRIAKIYDQSVKRDVSTGDLDQLAVDISGRSRVISDET